MTTHLATKKLTENKGCINYTLPLVTSMFRMKILRYKNVFETLRKKIPPP